MTDPIKTDLIEEMDCKNCKYFSKCSRGKEGSSCIDFEKAEIIVKIKKQIRLPKGKLISEFCQEVAEAIEPAKRIFFRPATLEIIEIRKKDNLSSSILSPLTPSRAITLFESFIEPIENSQTRFGIMTVPKSMTSELTKTILESPQFQNKLSQIKRIFTIPLPILYEGNLTFPKKGFDSRFNSWLDVNSPDITNENLTLEEAKQNILALYEEFCFKTEQDKTNAIAGLITPFLRGLYKSPTTRTPFFFYMGNRERTGKDYCAGITRIALEGSSTEEPPIVSDNKNDEELRKKILSFFMCGKKFAHFANNKGILDSGVLEQVLTAECFSDRVLGSNRSLNLDNEMDFSASGNVGISFSPDLANRMRIIRLHLDVEDANSRTFKNPNLHQYVKDNRNLILSSIYVLIKNWIEKGLPSGSLPFASFPEWARVCGGVMETAGFGNPCVPDVETLGISGDSETSEMKTLFEVCNEKHPNDFLTTGMIRQIAEDESLFGFWDFNKKSDQTKFGIKLNKFIGRILSDIRLIVENPTERASRKKFRFISMKEIPNKCEKLGHLGNLGNLSPSAIVENNNFIYKDKNDTLGCLGCQNEELCIETIKVNGSKMCSICKEDLKGSEWSFNNKKVCQRCLEQLKGGEES